MDINDSKTARGRLKIAPSKDLRKYTQQIWLAGLGAFSRAEEEGGKLFDNLVKIGDTSGRVTKAVPAAPGANVRGQIACRAHRGVEQHRA